jgi:hypothetical protein
LWTIGLKSIIVVLVVPVGSARYVKGKVPTIQPKIFAKSNTSSSEINW